MKRQICFVGLVCALLVVGCESAPATPGFVALQAEVVSVSGSIEGRTLAATSFTSVIADRFENQGTFRLESAGVQVSVSACPVGDIELDPYGGGGGGRPGEPVGRDAGLDGDPGALATFDCGTSDVTVCDAQGCVGWSGDDVRVEVVDGSEWRQLAAPGGDDGVRVELRFRDVR